MLSGELEICLKQAFSEARRARHGVLGIEHLLLAILDVQGVREVLQGCGANLEQLSADLQLHAKANTVLLVSGEDCTVQPQSGFQRVLQRAAFHVQSGGKTEVGVLNVLTAIFSEKHSHAVMLLGRMGVTRLMVVNYLSGLRPP